MRKRRDIIILLMGIGSFILISLLLVDHIYSYYLSVKTDFYQNVIDAFSEAVKKDVDNRKKVLVKTWIFGFSENVAGDSVTLITQQEELKTFRDASNQKVDEKYINIIQSILYEKHPLQVVPLDSLFHEELLSKNIMGQTAVQLIDNILDTTYCSSKDLSLLTPVFLKPIDVGTRKEISLQAYTEVSLVFILKRMDKSYWFIVAGWLFVVIGCAIFIPYLMRKTKIEALQDCTKQILDFSSNQKKDLVDDVVEVVYKEGLVGYPTQETAVSEIPEISETPEVLPKSEVKEEIEEFYESPKSPFQLSKELTFNFNNYTLYCKGEPVNMTLLPAKLLGAFLEAPNYYLSRDDLRKIVWSNIRVTDEAIRRCVSRLNVGLSSGPDVKVVNLPREGYRLDFPYKGQDTDTLNNFSVKSVPTDSLIEERTDTPCDSTVDPDISVQT